MKKFLLVIIILFAIFSFFGVANAQVVTLTGWAWGGSNDGGLAVPGSPIDTGVGAIRMSGSTITGGTYGVDMDASGNLSGYAWSSNIGWIDFSGVKLDPSVSSGKANIVDINSEYNSNSPIYPGNTNWTGGIDMSGVKIVNNKLSGYGWCEGGEIIDGNNYGLGWIDFSGVTVPCVQNFTQQCVFSTEVPCDQTNCNLENFIGQTATCVQDDGCGISKTLDPLDPSTTCGESCKDILKTCDNSACALGDGSWKEIAP